MSSLEIGNQEADSQQTDLPNSLRYLLMIMLFLASCALLYMSSIRFTLFEQNVLCWSLIFILVIVRKYTAFNNAAGRILIIVLGTFISFRYMSWRIADTLIYTGPIDYLMMSVLFIAELEVFTVHLAGLFTSAWPMRRPHRIFEYDELTCPSVDVYIPTYVEPEELVEITIIACTQIDYPPSKLNIYILDDGATQQRCEDRVIGPACLERRKTLEAYATKHRVTYITREKNEGAKAGNINHALDQTSGDIILVLDCDHVPTQDILRRTVGYFEEDEKLYLVQTPHFFINPDPIEKNVGSFHSAPSENEMFYRGNLPAVDLWNSSFFCGSAGLLRRSCLLEIGGISGETITEDAESSLMLHAKGFRSLYVPRPMVCGLSPETFSDFILQRSRWCQGMLQMGFLKNPFLIPGLSFAQRICYTNVYLFWFFGFARFVFFVAPTVYLLFDIKIYHASIEQVFAYAFPHLIASFLVTSYLFGKYRWPLFSDLYESVQSIFLLSAVIGVIKNPRKPTFMVTPKGVLHEDDFLSPLAKPFYILFIIMLVSVPVSFYKLIYYPEFKDGVIICLGWLSINLAIAIASLGIFWEKRQIRHVHRSWAEGSVDIHNISNELVFSEELSDLSVDGLGFTMKEKNRIKVDDRLGISIKDSYGKNHQLFVLVKRVLIKGKGASGEDEYIVGCEYENRDLNLGEIVALVYGDSKRWLDFWYRDTKTPSIFHVARDFVYLGGRGLKHGLSELLRLFKPFMKTHIKVEIESDAR